MIDDGMERHQGPLARPLFLQQHQVIPAKPLRYHEVACDLVVFIVIPMDRCKLVRVISEHKTFATRALQFVVEQFFVHRYSFQRNILVTGIAGVLRAFGRNPCLFGASASHRQGELSP